MQLQENQQKAQKTEHQRRILRRLFFGAITGGETQFSLGERVYLLWSAPVTKFWTFQVLPEIFYTLPVSILIINHFFTVFLLVLPDTLQRRDVDACLSSHGGSTKVQPHVGYLIRNGGYSG